MKTTPLCSALVALLIFTVLPNQNLQAATADELRAEAKALMQKARDLKAAERYEKSEKLAREARQLQLQARELADEDPHQSFGPDDVNAQLESLRDKLTQLEGTDRQDDAAEVRRQIRKIERSVAARGRGPSLDVEDREPPKGEDEGGPRPERFAGPDGRQRPPGEFGDRRQPGPPRGPMMPDGADRPQRLQHLQQAIEHLHAAGWHEMADRLEREAMGFQRDGGRSRDFRPEPPAPGLREPQRDVREIESNMAEMRRQMNELRHALEQMRQMIDRRGAGER